MLLAKIIDQSITFPPSYRDFLQKWPFDAYIYLAAFGLVFLHCI